ncbi:hypothetical protein KPH14_003249 [Odynerus spinipes]|uniref:Uncharacterized protein n=1 Tax=Odynerus spinipes TaxID=1348599 RepID=A0AAD9RH49_9HYME|nr:hypothetical protein KPH14_003249 [Odynerus spinipes]
MDSVIVIGLTVLTVCMSVGGAAGACVHVKNDDMLEYSCVGGNTVDLNTIPATVEKIRISNMHVPIITTDMFSRFGPTLWVLSCSHCDITDIEPNAFRSLVNLQQLSLDNNRLTTVKASWFEGFEYLTYLDLNYNQITKIEDGVFENLPSLVDFRLSGNRFECLNTQAMDNLQNLKRMFLSENPEFKCPNAISKFLDDREVSFDRDPEWKDIDEVSVGEVVPTDTTMVDERRTTYWSTTPPYRERLHLPPVVAPTEDTRSSYQAPSERAPASETIRYPLYAPVSVTTPNYRDRISQYPSIDPSPVTTTEDESDVPQYQRPPITDPYRAYVTTPQPSRYPPTQPWPSVSKEDDITEYNEYYERFDYSDEVTGTASLATSPTDRGASPPLLDPKNTPSTQSPEIYWTRNGILIEPNYPLPNPPWNPELDGDDTQTIGTEDFQTIGTEDTQTIGTEDTQTFKPAYVPQPPPPPELVQPAAPSDFLQVPYYEPTVTIRRPPPSVLQNYDEQSTTVAPLETTTDVPLPECPRSSSSPRRTLSIKETITFLVLIFLANIIV